MGKLTVDIPDDVALKLAKASDYRTDHIDGDDLIGEPAGDDLGEADIPDILDGHI